MARHRFDYSKDDQEKTTSSKVFQKYGLDTCRIILVESIETTSKEELRAREFEYIKNHPCVNKVGKGRDPENQRKYLHEYYIVNRNTILNRRKQYCEDHQEQIENYAREYYKTHSETIKKIRNEKNQCECGGSYSKGNLSTHSRTIKHQEYLKNNQKIPKE
jgi:hypothetical protein